jgi:hypothetical protein
MVTCLWVNVVHGDFIIQFSEMKDESTKIPPWKKLCEVCSYRKEKSRGVRPLRSGQTPKYQPKNIAQRT